MKDSIKSQISKILRENDNDIDMDIDDHHYFHFDLLSNIQATFQSWVEIYL